MEEVIVVKAGGSGNMVSTEYTPPFEWLEYRRIQFDTDRFHRLRSALHEASAKSKIVFVTGGAGAYLFTSLARSLGVGVEIQQRIGCSIVRTLAELLLQSQATITKQICPYLVPASEVIDSLPRYRLIFVEPDTSFVSTDTLAASIAANVPNRRLLFFKETVPIYHFLAASPTRAPVLSASTLLQYSQAFEPKPGDNFFMEREALKIMIETGIPTWFYNSNDLGQLAQIIDFPDSLPNTRLVYG